MTCAPRAPDKPRHKAHRQLARAWRAFALLACVLIATGFDTHPARLTFAEQQARVTDAIEILAAAAQNAALPLVEGGSQ